MVPFKAIIKGNQTWFCSTHYPGKSNLIPFKAIIRGNQTWFRSKPLSEEIKLGSVQIHYQGKSNLVPFKSIIKGNQTWFRSKPSICPWNQNNLHSMQSSQKIKTTFVYCRLPRKLKTDSGKILLPIKSKRHPFNSICHLPYKSNLVPFTPNPPKRTRLKNLLRNSLSGSKKDGGATQFSLRCKRNSHRYSNSRKNSGFFFLIPWIKIIRMSYLSERA